jgi:hypothetical protein
MFPDLEVAFLEVVFGDARTTLLFLTVDLTSLFEYDFCLALLGVLLTTRIPIKVLLYGKEGGFYPSPLR